MAASFVTLFQWRLNSMLLQENEILLGVKDQIESLINKLDAVGSFTGDVDRILGRESCHLTWASELRGMLCEAEDFVDDFIIKVYGQTEKDREDSIAEFRNELQNIYSRVSEILNRRPRLEASLMLEEIERFLRSKFVFDEDKETALVSCMLNYINLPYDLKLSLLFYCAFLGRYGQTKGALVRVLVAAGLIQEKPGELMEDKAQENIDRLVDLGMLEEGQTEWDCLRVPSPYYKLSLSVMNAEAKMEYLTIASKDLVEWTEIEEGALPSLKQLKFSNCTRLMVLPEGLQHVTTLQILNLRNVHEDLIRRLSPNGGPENYKIKHIPQVTYLGHMMSQGFWTQ